MSAGNLYRYFPSKEALVEGICLHDQRERVGAFQAVAHSDNLLATLETLLRDNVVNRPLHKTVLILEVAAEAARNPRIAEMIRANDADVLSGLAGLVSAAKGLGQAAAELDPWFAARLMFTYVGGLFRRRVLDENFDVEDEVAMTMALLRALFAGAILPSPLRRRRTDALRSRFFARRCRAGRRAGRRLHACARCASLDCARRGSGARRRAANGQRRFRRRSRLRRSAVRLRHAGRARGRRECRRRDRRADDCRTRRRGRRHGRRRPSAGAARSQPDRRPDCPERRRERARRRFDRAGEKRDRPGAGAARLCARRL